MIAQIMNDESLSEEAKYKVDQIKKQMALKMQLVEDKLKAMIAQIMNDESLSEEEKQKMIAALKKAAMKARSKILAETRKLLNEEREAVKDISADLVKLEGLAERARLLAEGKLTGPAARKAMEEIIFGLKQSLGTLRTWV